MGERWRAGGTLVMLALAIVAIGCGGDSSTGAEESVGEGREYPWVTGVAREFLVPEGDNLVQSFGEEGTAAEREEASKVVHAWMKARVAEDWTTVCGFLSRPYVKNLLWDVRGVTEGRVKTCPGALEYFGENAVGKSGNSLTGPIDSLRVKGPDDVETEWEAWAQWHGATKDWVLPLEREGGVWKVASASPVDRLR
ncbi:MAG TPA: hypothetical protein VGK41_06675 [Solirubrobacterales bacterium]